MDINALCFLRIPTEIRYKIYSLLIPQKHLFCIDRAASESNIGQVRRLRSLDKEWWTPARTRVGPFLLINRVISAEVLDLLYGNNTFAFYDPWLIETFIVRIGPTNLGRISHVSVQAGSLNRSNNTASSTTIFSIVSSCFRNLQTLRVVGVGRGNERHGRYDPLLWLPAHLDRLAFIISLPGVLKNARVYCDRQEQNSRILCNGAKYRTEWDELEVDMEKAREDAQTYKKNEKRRELERAENSGAIADDLSFEVKGPRLRKRAKVSPTYRWKY